MKKIKLLRKGLVQAVLFVAIGALTFASCAKDYDDDLKNVQETAKFNKEQLTTVLDGYHALIKANNDLIKNLQASVDKTNADLGTTDAKANKLIEDLKAVTATMNQKVAEINRAIADNTSAINRNKEASDKAFKDIADQFTALTTRMGTYDARLDLMSQNYIDLTKTVQEYEELLYRLIGGMLELGEDVQKLRQKLNNEIARVEALTNKLTGANADSIVKVKQHLADLQTALNDSIARLSANMLAADNELKQQIADSTKKCYTDIVNKYDPQLLAISGRIDALEAKVNNLICRIQSIVYVPETEKGKGVLPVINSEAQAFVMTYMLTADGALDGKAIADSVVSRWANKTAEITTVTTKIKTKAIVASPFVVTNVANGAADGTIDVTMAYTGETADLGKAPSVPDQIIETNMPYSLSLKISDNAGNNKMTTFTGMLAALESKLLEKDLIFTGKNQLNGANYFKSLAEAINLPDASCPAITMVNNNTTVQLRDNSIASVATLGKPYVATQVGGIIRVYNALGQEISQNSGFISDRYGVFYSNNPQLIGHTYRVIFTVRALINNTTEDSKVPEYLGEQRYVAIMVTVQ